MFVAALHSEAKLGLSSSVFAVPSFCVSLVLSQESLEVVVEFSGILMRLELLDSPRYTETTHGLRAIWVFMPCLPCFQHVSRIAVSCHDFPIPKTIDGMEG